MTPGPPHPYLENKALLLLLVAVTLAMGWILLPFSGTLMWSAIIALLFAPVYRRLLKRLRGRRNLAALLTLVLVLLIVILPLLAVLAALAQEAATVSAQLKTGEFNPERFFSQAFTALPGWARRLLARVGLANFAALQRSFAVGLGQAGQFMAGQALSMGQITLDFITSLFITGYLSFFFIRDGEQLAHSVRRAIPLAQEHRLELVGKFTTVIRATVKGNLLVAAIQGLLGGLAFWVLDIQGAALWGVVMAFASLLPAVGAALVWVPVAAYFGLLNDWWPSLALVLWGVFVIGLVDNLLRPLLVGRDTRMPDYVVLISTLGGMSVFGLNGFVIGPTIAALFIAVWHIRDGLNTDALPAVPTAPEVRERE